MRRVYTATEPSLSRQYDDDEWAAMQPRAAVGSFPYPGHRNLAEVDRDEALTPSPAADPLTDCGSFAAETPILGGEGCLV